MENYIESRVILGLLILIHAFVSYPSSNSCGHINRKLLNGFFVTELIVVTCYIIYDNLQTPPHDGWFLAIVGYLVVYALIFMTWVSYFIYTQLEENEVYEMTISQHVRLMHVDYFKGTILKDNRAIEVLLPYLPELDISDKANRKQKVMFDRVIRGLYILVKPVLNSDTNGIKSDVHTAKGSEYLHDSCRKKDDFYFWDDDDFL